MKKMLSFVLLLISDACLAGVGGGADKRQVIGWLYSRPDYVNPNQENLWDTDPYNKVVYIVGPFGGVGTGSFISPKHILTNAHVANCCGLCNGSNPGEKRKKCTVITSNGAYLDASVVLHGAKTSKEAIQTISSDWSIIEVENYCSKNYFKISETSTNSSNLWLAGFGALRVLSTKDIKNIRDAYKEWLKVVYPYDVIDRRKKLKDGVDMYLGNYDIMGSKGHEQYKTFLDKYKEITGNDFFADCMSDSDTLKATTNCSIGKIEDGAIYHNCQTWAGDSGSSIQNTSNTILGLNKGGSRYITSKKDYINFGPAMQSIFKNSKVKSILSEPCTEKEQSEEIKPEKHSDDEKQQDTVITLWSRRIGDECIDQDLPAHAISGYYIRSGINKLECDNAQTCSCAATYCEPNYYLVVNSKGYSQGWCYTHNCPNGSKLNIIDGYKTDKTCINN